VIGGFRALKIHDAVGTAKTQTGKGVDDAAQSVIALQVGGPAIGLVAVHILQKARMVGMLKHGLNFGAQGHGILHTPLRKHAGMHHEKVLTQRIGVQASQRLLAQPVQQGIAIGCAQNLGQSVALALTAKAPAAASRCRS
jgi:hypothetical protein